MTAAGPPHAPHGTAVQYEQAQQEEWSRYVALVPIDFYGTRAYNPGAPVPVSAVVENGDPTGEPGAPWVRREWVAEQGGGQVVEATSPPIEQPPIDPTQVAAPPGSAAAPPPEPSPDGSTITSSEG